MNSEFSIILIIIISCTIIIGLTLYFLTMEIKYLGNKIAEANKKAEIACTALGHKIHHLSKWD